MTLVSLLTSNILQPIKTMLERRQTYLQSKSSTSPNGGSPPSPRSVYREIAFLTLVSLGQENIDMSAFDREYKRAFDVLATSKHAQLCHACDQPPAASTGFCRKLFRELNI